MTAQELPGGQSMTVRPGASPASASAAAMTGVPVASPGSSSPVTTRTPPLSPVSTRPSSRRVSPTAPSGQTQAQTPQEWQTSGKTSGAPFTSTSALKRQRSTHFRQPVHFAASKTGRARVTGAETGFSGRRKRRPFGSSTSQST